MKTKNFYSKLLMLAIFMVIFGSAFAQPTFSLATRVTGTGSTFYVYINVKNTAAISTGSNNATNVVVTCPLPSGATFVSANYDGTLSGPNVVWSFPVLGGLNAITPTFIFTIPGGSATIAMNSITVACSQPATATGPAAAITKNFTAAGAIVEVATTGNDVTAAANILAAGNSFSLPAGSTHPDFPYLTWDLAMGRIKTNNTKCQTLKFKPGIYNDGSNNTASETARTIVNTSNSWTSGNFDGLTIDGQGAEIQGSGTNSWLVINNSGISISDLTIKNLIITSFDNRDNSASAAPIYDCDGLVIDRCVFYSNILFQPLAIITTNSKNVASTVSNCVFSGNSFNTEGASSGGMQYDGSGSGTVESWHNQDNNRYTCNRRNAEGGALRIETGDDLRRSTFNISKCHFEGNTSSTLGSGGAALFVGSQSSSANPGSVNIYNTNFIGNVLNGSTSGLGGQFLANGNVININGGEFKNGGAQSATSGLRGGAIGYAGQEILINNVTITGNFGTFSEGAIRVNTGTVAFADNSIIHSNSGTPQVSGITFGAGSTVSTGTPPAAPAGVTTNCFVYSHNLNISGNVFNDGNALTDNLVNGAGVTAANAGTLYVAVVNSLTGLVAGYATINATTGAYNITNVASGVATSSPPTFTLVLSTTLPVVGNSITPSVPAGWQNTGENFGVPTLVGHDGTVNAILSNYSSTAISGTTVTNLNLAINKIPVVGIATATEQQTPTGTTSVAVNGLLTSGGSAIFSANDLETTLSYITITSFPTGANSFSIGTTTYYPVGSLPGTCPTATCLEFPTSGGVNVPTNASGVPTSLSVDPSFADIGNVVFSYTAVDAAGAVSSVGTATIPFSNLLPLTIVSFKGIAKLNCTNEVVLKLSAGSDVSAIVLEKSTNGFNFVSIDTKYLSVVIPVDSDYIFNDNNVDKNTYYRAKLVDLNGIISYTPTIKLATNCGKILSANVFPNPLVNSIATINIESKSATKAEITWFNSVGKMVKTTVVNLHSGANTIKNNLNGLANGAYFVKISVNGEVMSLNKIVKQ